MLVIGQSAASTVVQWDHDTFAMLVIGQCVGHVLQAQCLTTQITRLPRIGWIVFIILTHFLKVASKLLGMHIPLSPLLPFVSSTESSLSIKT